MKKLIVFAGCLSVLALFSSFHDKNTFNPFFSIEDEIRLGQQVAQEVESDPNVKVLDERRYATAYGHLRRITDNILNSGQVRYRKEFPWQIKIIHNDTILNAFCAPGGYIYVYTGIIKYLDTEDQFAGVMAHEIAHADRRHVTNNLLRIHGLNVVMSMITGNNRSQLAELGAGLLALNFSRKHERDADDMSVVYLCNTQYQANGAAGFFEKMLKDNPGAQPPAFLSTHPASASRVRDINNAARSRNCSTRNSNSNYQAFKNSLPR